MPQVPVVYIDVVFLVNIVMDAMLLWTTGWLMKRKLRFRRILLGALLGATYALLLFVPSLSLLTTWPGKAVVSVVLVYVALPRKNMLDLARLVVVYYFVSFVFAGAAIAIGFAVPGESLHNGIAVSGKGIMFATSGETLALMVAVPLCVFGMQRMIQHIRKVQRQGQFLCSVEALFDDMTIRFKGLLDSGNQLYDPVSRRPVSFVDMDVLLPVLPNEVQERLCSGEDIMSAVAAMATSQKFTLVPFQGASGRGLTIALKPSAIRLVTSKGSFVEVTEPNLLAVYPGHLSGDDSFQAILHMDLMNGDDQVEEIPDTSRPQDEVAYTPPTALHSNSSQTPR